MVMETGEEGRQEQPCLFLRVHVTEECFSGIAEIASWWQKYLVLHLKRQNCRRWLYTGSLQTCAVIIIFK